MSKASSRIDRMLKEVKALDAFTEPQQSLEARLAELEGMSDEEVVQDYMQALKRPTRSKKLTLSQSIEQVKSTGDRELIAMMNEHLSELGHPLIE